jgi:Breast carcinoma amplified sequence 2 (BCAS2)
MGEDRDTDLSPLHQDEGQHGPTGAMTAAVPSNPESTAHPAAPHSVVMDSLPYVDALPEEYEQYALALIEDEMASLHSKKLRHFPVHALNRPTEILQRGLELLASTGGTEPYTAKPENGELLNQPTVFDDPPASNETNLDVWRRSVNRARVEYEAERIRSVILGVEKDEQSVLWRDWKTVQHLLLERWRKNLDEEQQAVESINADRQSDQLKKGGQLQILNGQYHDLVQKLDRLRQATTELSDSVDVAKPPVTPRAV